MAVSARECRFAGANKLRVRGRSRFAPLFRPHAPGCTCHALARDQRSTAQARRPHGVAEQANAAVGGRGKRADDSARPSLIVTRETRACSHGSVSSTRQSVIPTRAGAGSARQGSGSTQEPSGSARYPSGLAHDSSGSAHYPSCLTHASSGSACYSSGLTRQGEATFRVTRAAFSRSTPAARRSNGLARR